MATLKLYIFNILVAIDQLVNSFLAGAPDETLSSRSGKAADKGEKWACVLCKFLDYMDKNHCKNSIESDRGSKAVDQD
jgi:hypothetical protein